MQLSFAIHDGGSHETCFEMLRFRATFAVDAGMEKGNGENRFLVQSAMADFMKQSVEAVRFHAKSAMETSMGKSAGEMRFHVQSAMGES